MFLATVEVVAGVTEQRYPVAERFEFRKFFGEKELVLHRRDGVFEAVEVADLESLRMRGRSPAQPPS